MCTPYGFFDSYASINQLSQIGELFRDERSDGNLHSTSVGCNSVTDCERSEQYEHYLFMADDTECNLKFDSDYATSDCRQAESGWYCDEKREKHFHFDSEDSSKHRTKSKAIESTHRNENEKRNCAAEEIQTNHSVHNSSSKGPHFLKFPQKLWNIINSQNDAIKWGANGETIIINYDLFQDQYLSENRSVFKTRNVASFIRQLNLYGFRKVNHSLSNVKSGNQNSHEFKHQYFKLGREDLLQEVTRKYSASSTSLMSFPISRGSAMRTRTASNSLPFRTVKRLVFSDKARNKRRKNGWKVSTYNTVESYGKFRGNAVKGADGKLEIMSRKNENENEKESNDCMGKQVTNKMEKYHRLFDDVLNKQREAYSGKAEKNDNLKTASKKKSQDSNSKSKPKYDINAENKYLDDSEEATNYYERQTETASCYEQYWPSQSSQPQSSGNSSGNVTLIMDPSITPTKAQSINHQATEDVIYDSVIEQYDDFLAGGDSAALPFLYIHH
ncbi:Heat shock factor protein 5-like protein [Dinothrombium tinctorium]|uniref:Heat shock factor protein 5-like protein n=1 Tax=Dinothrombium tinctorium TaxID=1965070 RepID=A0A443RFS4_9ACAR|nr:Heat shock factor protein 5-like protein [Dinothrombium tinctorium]RWS14126.1 Heat shock factor protein 5-like protein [Dinothrombium tinctorium]